jgi:hypothetical protein
MGWVVSVTPRPRFTPFGTHWIGGWLGPRAGLDAGARRKICLCRGSNLDRPIVQPVVRHYTAWATAPWIGLMDLISDFSENISESINRTDVSDSTARSIIRHKSLKHNRVWRHPAYKVLLPGYERYCLIRKCGIASRDAWSSVLFISSFWIWE